MHKAVYALFYADKKAKIRYILHGALNHRALRILLLYEVPGVGLDLLEAQGNPPCLRVYLEDNCLYLVTHLEHLLWVPYSLGPGHLGDVNKPFHTLFQLNKGTVLCEVHHPS